MTRHEQRRGRPDDRGRQGPRRSGRSTGTGGAAPREGDGRRPAATGGAGRERPRLPGAVYRDLRAAAGSSVDAVAWAYAEAGDALERDDAARAVELLRDAKRGAGRSAVVREALGIALYRDGQYHEAGRELAAYRRLSGLRDQHHLAADCARATGRPDRAEALVAEMMDADVPAARVAEGLLVIAGSRADSGDPRAALAALHRVDLSPRVVEPYHLRLWYLAGDLHERLGEHDHARGFFASIATVDPEFGDVDARLAALEPATDEGQSAEAGDDPSSPGPRVRQ